MGKVCLHRAVHGPSRAADWCCSRTCLGFRSSVVATATAPSQKSDGPMLRKAPGGPAPGVSEGLKNIDLQRAGRCHLVFNLGIYSLGRHNWPEWPAGVGPKFWPRITVPRGKPSSSAVAARVLTSIKSVNVADLPTRRVGPLQLLRPRRETRLVRILPGHVWVNMWVRMGQRVPKSAYCVCVCVPVLWPTSCCLSNSARRAPSQPARCWRRPRIPPTRRHRHRGRPQQQRIGAATFWNARILKKTLLECWSNSARIRPLLA